MPVNNLKEIDQKLQNWYHRSLGQKILHQETQLAVQLCRKQKAHSVLHLGGLKHQFHDLAATNAQVEDIALGSLGSGKHPLLMPCADSNKLRPQSYDHIVITQCLEWYKAPVPLLNDCCQLLVDSGRLVVYGFNPWSLWGLAHALYQGTGLPVGGTMHSVAALQEWMQQLGLQIESTSSFCFRPPLHKSRNFDSMLWMEKIGKWAWPYCGAFYQIVAQKNSYASSSVWQGWRKRRQGKEKVVDSYPDPKPTVNLDNK